MGKLKGIVQFTGNFEGISFYESEGKIIIRRTGGFDGKAIKTQERYVRTRENASEFGHSTKVGKQLRQALGGYSQKVKTTHTHSRLAGVLMKVMQCDTVSERGKRTVALGLITAEGKQVLQGFEFDADKPLSGIMASPYRVMLDAGKVAFDNFDVKAVVFPEGATHLSLQFLVLRHDVAEGKFTLGEGEKTVITKQSVMPGLELTAPITDGDGMVIGLVFWEFFQEMNGELYGLKECGMKVVGVG
jgi:hypothetical protein